MRRALLCAALALGCRDDEVAFAVQQGYLTAGEAPSGYWVWTFLPAAWERDNDPELLLCSRVQRIRGARIDPASLSGARVFVSTWDWDGGWRPLARETGSFIVGGGGPKGPKLWSASPVITLP